MTLFNILIQQKKVELKETLLNELQEKKKVIESERISMELTGGQHKILLV